MTDPKKALDVDAFVEKWAIRYDDAGYAVFSKEERASMRADLEEMLWAARQSTYEKEMAERQAQFQGHI